MKMDWADVHGDYHRHWKNEYPLFRNFVLYSELFGVLQGLQDKSAGRMRLDVIGQSDGGRDLYLVTLGSSQTLADIEDWRRFRRDVARYPEQAMASIRQGQMAKAPVFINCSLHGNEITGTDGALLLIDRLLDTPDDPEIAQIFEHLIILINICANPDGRAQGLGGNSGGDLNRDFLTQSRPETRAVVRHVAQEWFPVSVVDLHGFFSEYNVSIDACTKPHNPNYEYDLLGDRIIASAQAMAAEITGQLGLPVDIPAVKLSEGWDDYGPVFTPQYFMYLGALGHTVEVKFPDQEGIFTAMLASFGALKYVAANCREMLLNQLEIFRRGIAGIASASPVFPVAYLVPLWDDLQRNPAEARRMVNHLIENGIAVDLTLADFCDGTRLFPAGSYLISMRQGLRGLANTMLWRGEDLSRSQKSMYDLSSYSFPIMCGFDVYPLQAEVGVAVRPADKVAIPAGFFYTEGTGDFIFRAENIQAFAAANSLLRQGFKIGRAPSGDFIIPAAQSGLQAALLPLAQGLGINVSTAPPRHRPPQQQLRLGKVAVVADSYGPFQALSEMGFDVHFVDHLYLNRGLDLAREGFESLVFGGTETGIWTDQFADFNGVGYGMNFALNQRGRDQVIAFAEAGHNFIGFGYAGAKLNEAVGRLDVSYAFTSGAEGAWMTNLDKFDQATENGFCQIELAPGDSLARSGSRNQEIYVMGPVWFERVGADVKVGASFARGDFYAGGFWLEPEKAAGQPVLLYGASAGQKVVLIGFDPAFRSYTRGTYPLLADALYWISNQDET